MRRWQPNSRPQLEFLAASEFECLYGGAKGGAKTESLVIAPLQQVEHPAFRGLLLREVFKELREIQDRCAKYYKPSYGAEWRDKDSRWVFPSGAFIEVGFCESERDIGGYMGREWTYIGFDELGNLKDERPYELLTAEVRSPDKRLVRMVRATANPGGKGHAWVKRRFITATDYGRSVYRDPTTGLTRRFIKSRVTDNPVYANDQQYMAVLMGLSEVKRRQLLEGDWDAGEGMAFDELSRERHMPPGFRVEVPEWWYQWGALDIGFSHCWCYVWGAMDGMGNAYVVDSFHGRRDRYDEIAVRLKEAVPMAVLNTSVCDNFARAEGSRGFRDRTPSPAEILGDYGILMGNANQRRVQGLNNLRLWLGWRLANGQHKDHPSLRFFDTPGNRVLFDCLESMVMDPKNPEDVLKVHADDQGRGGDDPYDALRYLMADHPYSATPPKPAFRPVHDQDPTPPGHFSFGDPDEGGEDDSIGNLPSGF